MPSSDGPRATPPERHKGKAPINAVIGALTGRRTAAALGTPAETLPQSHRPRRRPAQECVPRSDSASDKSTPPAPDPGSGQGSATERAAHATVLRGRGHADNGHLENGDAVKKNGTLSPGPRVGPADQGGCPESDRRPQACDGRQHQGELPEPVATLYRVGRGPGGQRAAGGSGARRDLPGGTHRARGPQARHASDGRRRHRPSSIGRRG